MTRTTCVDDDMLRNFFVWGLKPEIRRELLLSPPATEETLEETPEVNLHSLTNPMNPRIFRILAKHKTEILEVLIDTGINYNFIQEGLVQKLGLTTETAKHFKGIYG